MFCMNCGAKMLAQDVFCANCGKQGVPTTNTQARPKNQMENSGGLLILEGQKYSGGIVAWIISLLADVFILSNGLSMLDQARTMGSMHRAQVRILGTLTAQELRNLGTFLVIFGVALAILSVTAIFLRLRWRKTQIRVYDNCVIASVYTNKFYSELQEMNLSYADIRNVDLIKQGGIIIYTQYERYFCYLKNPSEIQTAIKAYLK